MKIADSKFANCQVCLFVLRTKRVVDIQFQDGTIMEGVLSINCVPCLQLDEDDQWPVSSGVCDSERPLTVQGDSDRLCGFERRRRR